jgi:hypothetical protein
MPRVWPLAVALLLLSAPAAAAEKQVRPFAAVTFKGSTTFVLGNAVGKRHTVLGVGAALVGDIVGVEGEVSWGPGFFEPDPDRLVVRSGVTTATGGVILTLPKRLTEYTLRPYFVAGAGVMRVNISDVLSVFDPTKALAAYDIGGGAVGFLTSQVGLAWDVRRFGTLKASAQNPVRRLREEPLGCHFGAQAWLLWYATDRSAGTRLS